MISLADLLTPLTQAQVQASIISSLVGLGVPADQWRKGGALSTVVAVVAGLYAGFTTTMSSAIGAGFLETAVGPWLTMLAYYVFNVTRPPATFASGSVAITNSGGGIFSYSAGGAQFINASTGAAYTNSAPFTSNPGDVAKPVAVVASVIGTPSNASPGTVTAFGTQMLGCAVTNPAAIVGSDAMLDPDLRNLCLNKLGTLSNGGPRSAYQFAITSALNGGIPVNINRVSVSPSSSTGNVAIVVASPSGAPSAGDLAAATASVEALARPDAVTVTVSAATTATVTQALTLYSTGAGGVTPAQLVAGAQALMAYAFSVYPISGLAVPPATAGKMLGTWLEGVVQSSHFSIYAVTGGADVSIAAGQVAVDAVTVNAQIVPVS